MPATWSRKHSCGSTEIASALDAESNLPAWLFTALANLCRNRSRWNRRHPTVALDSTVDDDSRCVRTVAFRMNPILARNYNRQK